MKLKFVFFSIILVILIFGIGLQADYPNLPKNDSSQVLSVNYASPTIEITPLNAVREMIGQVNQERVLTDLRKLTGAAQICLDHGCYTITDRFTGGAGLQWAKDYIEEELIKVGFTVKKVDWSSDQILVAKKIGILHKNEEIYFVAHMDGVSNSPAADDDASGVVSLLEMARIINTHPFNNTIVMLFSTGEEEGTLGVQSYLEQLTPEEIQAIKYVVNVDMLGYDANNDGVIELFNGNQPEDFVQLLSTIISAYQINLTPQIYSDCG